MTRAVDRDTTEPQTDEEVMAAPGWTIDKRVPVLALLAFLVQFGGFIWYGATQNAAIQVMQRDANALATRTATLETKAGDMEIVKFRLDNVEKSTLRIESKLDDLADRAAAAPARK